ncbi:hypothetical protein COF44_26295 [Bacillus toyonensis]|nr:hypothetical protein CON67_02810 [Bacillus toyonensis]PGB38469.1 hypothetical protein COM07_15935 [Bacillus toyonensis]PGE40183.1 hypothetical protein COM60_07780 [Bacillus toyonensis]PHC95787.1 hypothetical protein COF44_26295 [Bacillus toyonensis]
MNKTQYSVNNVYDIRFSPFPLGDEQLAFASCSFVIHRHIMMKWSYIISKQKTLIYFSVSHFFLKEHFLKVLFLGSPE